MPGWTGHRPRCPLAFQPLSAQGSRAGREGGTWWALLQDCLRHSAWALARTAARPGGGAPDWPGWVRWEGLQAHVLCLGELQVRHGRHHAQHRCARWPDAGASPLHDRLHIPGEQPASLGRGLGQCCQTEGRRARGGGATQGRLTVSLERHIWFQSSELEQDLGALIWELKLCFLLGDEPLCCRAHLQPPPRHSGPTGLSGAPQ